MGTRLLEDRLGLSTHRRDAYCEPMTGIRGRLVDPVDDLLESRHPVAPFLDVSHSIHRTYCGVSIEPSASVPRPGSISVTNLPGEADQILTQIGEASIVSTFIALDGSARFFTKALGWTESGRDNSYPRTAAVARMLDCIMFFEPGGNRIELIWPGI
jgi:hypothetical protein